jgi:putative pyruvate formate lyase activating enzyme
VVRGGSVRAELHLIKARGNRVAKMVWMEQQDSFLNRAFSSRYCSSEFEPCYLKRLRAGAFRERISQAFRHLERCDLCARYCYVNRLVTVQGAVCRTGERAVVHSFGPHHGEEAVLRGYKGSGTIFFSWCNLRCVFCQNWQISHKGVGRAVQPRELAAMMLDLQEQGCHNINLVSPSHVVAQILAAVEIAALEGLRLPLVYNTGGYDSAEALALLDGVIDIYMPDMKYGDSLIARKYSKVRNYVEVNRMAVKEMHRQIGDLILDPNGLAQRGLLVRHLVLPGNLTGSEQVLDFLAHEISPNTYLNLMDQYRPSYRADEYPPLDRQITKAEYSAALELAKGYGLRRLDPGCERIRPV